MTVRSSPATGTGTGTGPRVDAAPGHRALRTGAGSLALSAITYLVAETVTAAAWRSPAYDYAANSVGDLGNPVCGPYDQRVSCSPLSSVMDVGTVVQGVLLALALVLLGRCAGRRLGVVLAVAGVLVGAGFALFGLLPVSPTAAADGTLAIHDVGTLVALLGSSALGVVVGLAGRRLGVGSPVVRSVLAALGVVGLAAQVVWLLTFYVLPSGAPQRVGIYTALAWELLLGGLLLRRRPPPGRGPAARPRATAGGRRT